uniref:Uncharacterized protein n=1 Tax=Glossina brevipalpis TaxID=37001 RepID=A0A1A9W514_9MUSC
MECVIGNPIPFTITTPQADLNSKTVEFNLTLPNDDVLKINISFVMMKVNKALETKDNDYLLRDQGNVTSLTTSTTIETPTTQQQQKQEQEKTTEQTALKYFSVDDAIEAFRKSLINSEMNIGGILEAEKPFYRHFNLKYENLRQPKINCFEYREFEQERILSNGEIEKVRTPDLSRRLQNIRIVDLKDYTQTYKMNITLLNDTTRTMVHLSLQLLTQLSKDKISTTTTTIPPQTNYNRAARHGDYKLFTIDDVIEAFKKDLIEKETNIGGIIESALAFHRHFNLKCENCEIRVKVL